MLNPIAPPKTLTFEEYLVAYNSVEGMKTEWNDGIVESYTMSNNLEHQEIIRFLIVFFEIFLSRFPLGKLVLNGLPMRIVGLKPAREPDLMIFLNEHRHRILHTYINGPADVVIEIVSPESIERDYDTKLREYAQAGIPEYWLIDPLEEQATVYHLDEQGSYNPLSVDDKGRMVSRVLPPFALEARVLWQDELPSVTDMMHMVQALG